MQTPYLQAVERVKPEVPWQYSPGLLDCEIGEAIGNVLRHLVTSFLP